MSGITALLALGILENMQEQGTCKPLLELEHNSPQYLHALIEALRFVGIYVLFVFRGAESLTY